MARGSLMCGNFVSLYVPTTIFLSSLGCIIIGGIFLGLDLGIIGIAFLMLAGILIIISIVMFSVICCCPQTSRHPQQPYIPCTQPVYSMTPQIGYPGQVALCGGAANQQVYALVPIHRQQQNEALVYPWKYQEQAITPTAPAFGTPEATADTKIPLHN